MTPEGKVQAYLKRRVKQLGGHYRKVKWIGRRNCPDDLIWWTAPGAWIECKAPGQKPTIGQMREHEKLRRDGWQVYVVDSQMSVDWVISRLHDAPKKVQTA